ncbi:MAG: hypothetical protein DRZ79_01145 [Candidatus Cloacimonadota bacterium]|nr:MAG: hypothetical protein DRZ79_01145 [Candidatus Cloacimonadota bacterium]
MRKILAFMFIMTVFQLNGDFRFGKELFDDGLYEEAILEFKKTVSEMPTSLDAQKSLLYLGKCYQKQEKYKDAEEIYQKLIQGYPKNQFMDEAFFELGYCRLQQNKYKTALTDFDKLLKEYPLSDFSQKAISYVLQSFFELSEYQMVIIKGRKFRKQYPQSKEIPEIILWMAKAYFAEKMPTEAKQLITELKNEYSTSAARWKAEELEIDLLKNEKGISAAALALQKKLEENIPRPFEEKFRMKLVQYYFALNDYRQANRELTKLLKKFTGSPALDKYVVWDFQALLELKNFNQIIEKSAQYDKIFKESSLRPEFKLILAKAYFHLGNYEKAKTIIDEILAENPEKKIVFETKFLQANILENTGKLKAAISEYQLLMKNFPDFGKTEELLMKIGDIYFEKFSMYPMAIKFYEKIITSSSNMEIQSKAAFKLALCYEKTGKCERAISELSQINLEEIRDSILVRKVEKKLNYLKKFKQKDFENAFWRLLNSIYGYLADNDKPQFQKNIISIMTDDLKELEKSAELLTDNKGNEFVYEKAKIYLKLAEKYRVENRSDSEKEFLRKADLLIAQIPSEKKQRIEELNIRRKLIEQNEKQNPALISQMEKFVDKYMENSAANEFALFLANYFERKKEIDKAIKYYSRVKQSNSIAEEDFLTAKLKLAEFYYQKNDNKNALKNYRLAENEINLNNPEIFFHFAVALNESGFSEEAIEKLSFLVENEENFVDYIAAVNYLINIFRQKKEFEKAIKYANFIPMEKRDDNFYLALANDYEILGDKENAKISLMHIQNKDSKILEKLAELQFETSDLEMAKYSYQQLLKKNPSNLQYLEKLAHIYFVEEDFLKAAENYKKIVDKIGDNFADYGNIANIAKENIISLYRVNNRPKAEMLTKKFKSVLNENALNEISLNKGIYYLEIDSKKAEKVFNTILKKQEINELVKMKAYFWRGVSRLKQKKIEQAKSDFKIVADSKFIDLSNQAHLKLGTLNFSAEKYQEALADYYQVIENDKSGKLALNAAKNFAFVCKTIGEWQKAISAYQIILERWGDSGLEAQTVFDIAFCYFRDKKYAKAIEMFEKALPLIEDKEQQAETQYWIGESYFGLEDYESAVRELLKVSYNYPDYTQWSASAELRAGEAYFNLGKYDKAKRIYEKLISKYGKFSDWGKEAAKRLESL